MNLNKRSQEVHLANLGVERRGTKDVRGKERNINTRKGMWEEARDKGREPRKEERVLARKRVGVRKW